MIRELWTGEVVTAAGQALPGGHRAHLHAAGPAAADLHVRVRAQGARGRGPDRRRLHLHAGRRGHGVVRSRRSPAASRPRAASRSPGRRPRTRAWTTRTGSGPTPAVPGELAQVLPSPAALRAGLPAGDPRVHRRTASSRATRSTSTSSRCGRSSTPGYDEVYVANMGPHYREMIEAYGRDVLPAVRG